MVTGAFSIGRLRRLRPKLRASPGDGMRVGGPQLNTQYTHCTSAKSKCEPCMYARAETWDILFEWNLSVVNVSCFRSLCLAEEHGSRHSLMSEGHDNAQTRAWPVGMQKDRSMCSTKGKTRRMGATGLGRLQSRVSRFAAGTWNLIQSMQE